MRIKDIVEEYLIDSVDAQLFFYSYLIHCHAVDDVIDGDRTEGTNGPTITQRSDDTDWTQELSVTFTQTIDGFIELEMKLMEYEAGNEVYVWPIPEIT
jgi:hypothetical protein